MTNKTITKRQALQIANVMIERLTPAEWENYLDKINAPQDQKFEISRQLDIRIQELAQVREYLDWRGGSGAGSDHGHWKAKLQSEKFLKRIRKTLGYTNP